ncbi:hypothetical protein DSO57_1032347 [Entomophthora muscae]|uniref:Uncharacterized protein n=1 Tax=Entomophthora muscae TaxID=34485 RepID=A0ACC2SPI4_9FUNG|nr:hypothetical protein DSO57_1032347 [Entomophthora muscae]
MKLLIVAAALTLVQALPANKVQTSLELEPLQKPTLQRRSDGDNDVLKPVNLIRRDHDTAKDILRRGEEASISDSHQNN